MIPATLLKNSAPMLAGYSKHALEMPREMTLIGETDAIGNFSDRRLTESCFDDVIVKHDTIHRRDRGRLPHDSPL